jgi:hypothetical protein
MRSEISGGTFLPQGVVLFGLKRQPVFSGVPGHEGVTMTAAFPRRPHLSPHLSPHLPRSRIRLGRSIS